jgi:site-specific recombinase XerD
MPFIRIYGKRGFFMLDIPSALKEQFEEYLLNKPIPNSSRGAYKKWLRYYLDFCRKYNFPPIRKESLPRFILKLQEKKQTKVQQAQAVKAITLYYEIFNAKGFTNKKSTPQTSSPPGYIILPKNWTVA